MFQEWGFLLGEIWVLLALAALLGLFAGWIIWGGRKDYTQEDKIQAKLDACRVELNKHMAQGAPKPTAATPVATPVSPGNDLGANLGEDYDGDGVFEGVDEGTRPEALSGPRDGKADDLKQIKGIGLKMEKLCNSLGFYHFDQIASWTQDEIAWVDANLDGFKGRVTRDDWVQQATTLAGGGSTEFSAKVSQGDVSY